MLTIEIILVVASAMLCVIGVGLALSARSDRRKSRELRSILRDLEPTRS